MKHPKKIVHFLIISMQVFDSLPIVGSLCAGVHISIHLSMLNVEMHLKIIVGKCKLINAKRIRKN